MVVDEQDNLPEATPREDELQRQLDRLQSQVTDLFGAWEAAQNPEISPEVQSMEGAARQTFRTAGAMSGKVYPIRAWKLYPPG
ncbi:hypothetical protein F2Q69_00021617 [Brassica cretica]|uniref:Uncharacterized protein n=1 Tax=Brassica cretica TaxID=69181 RepID=A0A8S9Q9Y2_BRACR|nr:hypothetical protein F2Q69_00021617 [Brassica cretica]